MTLSTMLCKSASSLAPLASRLVGQVNRHYHHSAVFTASNHPNRKQISSSFNVPDFHLSTAAATTKTMKPSADESGSPSPRLGNQVCLGTNKDHDRVEESTPSEFPFKIEDNPGQYTAILTREYRGELVKVEARMPMEGEHYRSPIKKEDLTIKNAAKSENSEDDQMPFEGPNFSDLDKNLKEAFHRYLDAKGINTGFIGFLYEYMRNKCAREHLVWLKKMKNFVEV